MNRYTTRTRIPHHAVIAVEEYDRDSARYKTIHNADCKALRDPENFNVDAGIKNLGDLAELLNGYCYVDYSVAEITDLMKPCAREALGL